MGWICRFLHISLEPAFSCCCKELSRKKPTLKWQQGAVHRDQQQPGPMYASYLLLLSGLLASDHRCSHIYFSQPSHQAAQREPPQLLLSQPCCKSRAGTHGKTPLSGACAALSWWNCEQGLDIPSFVQRRSQLSGSGFLFISSCRLAEGNSFPKDVIKLQSRRMRQETGIQTDSRKGEEGAQQVLVPILHYYLCRESVNLLTEVGRPSKA